MNLVLVEVSQYSSQDVPEADRLGEDVGKSHADKLLLDEVLRFADGDMPAQIPELLGVPGQSVDA